MQSSIEQRAIAVVRGIAMDAPRRASSGHTGTALALAPLAHVLYGRVMRHDPAAPRWPDRDRFVLSAGHASILQYAYLFLCGYGIGLDDLRAFRSWESITPGHPEVGRTPGIEVTTGPLGQGLANAVGMALAERSLRSRFGADVCDHHVFTIVSDGDLHEGISHEAASLAGHQRLGRLVAVYDDNHITIDGSIELSGRDDPRGRFEAYRWQVLEVGEVADDLDVLEQAVRAGMATTDRPTLVVLRSHIGWPAPSMTDNPKAHGEPFADDEIVATKARLGLPTDETFHVPDDVVAAYRAEVGERGARLHRAWLERFEAWDGDRAAWDAAWGRGHAEGWSAALPCFAEGERLATRQAMAKILSATAPGVPGLVAVSADLTANTGVKLDGGAILSADSPDGRQLHAGIREHGMAASANGMALHGGVLPVVATFLVFSDYLRPALRLAALSQAKVVFVFSHDSVAVGEDGPTHQPVEHLAALRAIPGLQVIRPADANETAAAWRVAVEHDGPTAIVLTRQAVGVVTDGSAVGPGAGVVVDVEAPAVVLLGTGSEVAVCLEAAGRLADEGIAARVVSMPSWDRFARLSATSRQAVLPPGVPVLSVEAATTFGWERWADDAVGIDRFGASAPGSEVLARLGVSADHVVERARHLCQRGGPT